MLAIEVGQCIVKTCRPVQNASENHEFLHKSSHLLLVSLR
jgi:hypothetical protein